MNEYHIFVYCDGWEQKPFSRKFYANTKDEAIKMCSLSLKDDEHIALKDDGSVWFNDYYGEPKMNECWSISWIRNYNGLNKSICGHTNVTAGTPFIEALKTALEIHKIIEEESKTIFDFHKVKE